MAEKKPTPKPGVGFLVVVEKDKMMAALDMSWSELLLRAEKGDGYSKVEVATSDGEYRLKWYVLRLFHHPE